MNKWLIVIIIIFVASIYALIYHTYKVDREQQDKLYANLKQLSHDHIASIEISSMDSGKKILVNDQHSIKLIQCLIGKADKKDVGGHNPPIYSWKFEFNFNNGNPVHLIGQVYAVYKHNQDALYFTSDKVNTGFSPKPIRVPQMGGWILTVDSEKQWIRKWGEKPKLYELHCN